MAILGTAYATGSWMFRSGDASTSDQSSLQASVHRRKATLPSGTPVTLPNGLNGGSRTLEKLEGELLCDAINEEEDLYKILGLPKKSTVDTIRRQFLSRSRLIHPDKLPHYAPATPAFQRLSFAYETLSKPSSRRLYDLGGGRGYDAGSPRDSSGLADETLNGVLRSVFTEFLDGDFEMIRVFVNALNEGNPGLNLGDESVDNLEGAFKRVRETLLAGQKYLRLLKFEIIRLYEIQHSLRSLSYFDLVGRLRLTLALTRVTLEIPLVLDKAMRLEEPTRGPNLHKKKSDDSSEDEKSTWEANGNPPMANGEAGGTEGSNGFGEMGNGEIQRRGLLGPRVKGVLVVACKYLEKGEKMGL